MDSLITNFSPKTSSFLHLRDVSCHLLQKLTFSICYNCWTFLKRLCIFARCSACTQFFYFFKITTPHFSVSRSCHLGYFFRRCRGIFGFCRDLHIITQVLLRLLPHLPPKPHPHPPPPQRRGGVSGGGGGRLGGGGWGWGLGGR